MIVSSSGYFATGSSAVFDLIREYDCFNTGKVLSNNYENVLFYTPGGIFDLEDKLLKGNSIHRSDEAIHTFMSEMERLYQNDFRWFGGYKKLIGNQFMDLCSDYCEELIDFKVDAHWSYHIKKEVFSVKRTVKNIFRAIQGKKINGSFTNKYCFRVRDRICYSFPSEEKFYRASSDFINRYFSLLMTDNKNLLVNHAFLPHNLHRLGNYSLPNIKIIVVDRDPRDVYSYINYGYKNSKTKSRIPTNTTDFIAFWKLLRSKEIKCNNESVLHVRFEDLIYQYEMTVNTIESFLGLDSSLHSFPKKYFNPAVSVRNTQLFRGSFVDKSSIKTIETELKSFLYDFPQKNDNYLMDGNSVFLGNAQDEMLI